ncbi:MAG: hypothetical protein ACON4H_17670 [Rubripirellula sp.]
MKIDAPPRSGTIQSTDPVVMHHHRRFGSSERFERHGTRRLLKSLAVKSLVVILFLLGFKVCTGQDFIQSPILPEQARLEQGFTLRLRYRSTPQAAYMPLKVELRGDGKFQRDRNFRLRVSTINESIVPKANGMEYEIDIGIEENQSEHVDLHMLPKWFVGEAFNLQLFEDDQPIPGYEWRIEEDYTGPLYTRGGVFENETKFNWLYVADSSAGAAIPKEMFPDLLSHIQNERISPDAKLARYFDQYGIVPAGGTGTRGSPPTTSPEEFWKQAKASGQLDYVWLNDVPDDWRYYQSHDSIVMQPHTFAKLYFSDPSRYAALKRWQMLGGTLVVLGSWDNIARIKAITDSRHGQGSKNQQTTPPTLTPQPFIYPVRGGDFNKEERISSREDGIAKEFIKQELQWLAEQMSAVLKGVPLEMGVDKIFAIEDAKGTEKLYYGYHDTGRESLYLNERVEANLSQSLIERFRVLSLCYHQLRTNRTLQIKDRKTRIALNEEPSWLSSWNADAQFGSVHEVGMGLQVFMHFGSAWKSENSSLPVRTRWEIAEKLAGDGFSPTVKRGVEPILSNQRFSDWKIPGIAEPPVYTFIGFLSGFFLLVGPIAYWQTKRIGRPYLMFAIAPTLALITTITMFGYGMIADGFGSFARVRQITWSDGRTGDGIERVRATYFTGSKQRTPLHFPREAEIFPYLNRGKASWGTMADLPEGNLGTVTLQDKQQWLSSTSLPSRSQQQFVSHHPRPQLGSLNIVQNWPADLSPPSVYSTTVNGRFQTWNPVVVPNVTNGFPFTLRSLIICDRIGNHWLINSLKPGDSANGKLLTRDDASRILGELYTTHRPIGSVSESRNSRSTRSNTRNNGEDFRDLTVRFLLEGNSKNRRTGGVLEEWLQQHLLTEGELPKMHFVVFSDVSDDAVAIDNCELKASVRYVMGTYQ